MNGWMAGSVSALHLLIRAGRRAITGRLLLGRLAGLHDLLTVRGLRAVHSLRLTVRRLRGRVAVVRVVLIRMAVRFVVLAVLIVGRLATCVAAVRPEAALFDHQ